MTFTAVNLSALPPPNVIEPVNPETELAEIKSELAAMFPADHPVIQAINLESEPITKVLEVLAYRYSLKKSEVNRKARALMLAYAGDGDLDHIGVTYYRVQRKLIKAADNTKTPPVTAVYESDSAYRERLALSVEAETKAGSAGAYIFHALSASSEVFSVQAHSPAPTEVDIYLAGQLEGDVLSQDTIAVGVSNSAINQVESVLLADDIRPLTDLVRVQSAFAVDYQINATVYVQNGISQALILEQGLQALRQYLTENYKPGSRVATSRIIGALDVPGVDRIELTSPTEDVIVSVGQVARCTNSNIEATRNV